MAIQSLYFKMGAFGNLGFTTFVILSHIKPTGKKDIHIKRRIELYFEKILKIPL